MAKTLIAYFSQAGQNYSHGSIRNLDMGNTKVVAKKIHALIIEDYDVWDFELSEEEMAQMTALERDDRFADY